MKRQKGPKQVLRGATSALGLLATIGAGQALLSRHVTGYPLRPRPPDPSRRRLIRPPGARAEPAFLAACIRCTRCQDVCEPGAIRMLSEADGQHYRTPVLDPAVKGCTICMKCTQVCPSGALQPMEPEEREQAGMGSVTLRKELCLSHKALQLRDTQALLVASGGQATEVDAELERRGPCGECYMFCPLRDRAIVLLPGGFLAPTVNPDRCVGCGLCEEVCRMVLRAEPAIRVLAHRSWA